MKAEVLRVQMVEHVVLVHVSPVQQNPATQDPGQNPAAVRVPCWSRGTALVRRSSYRPPRPTLRRARPRQRRGTVRVARL